MNAHRILSRALIGAVVVAGWSGLALAEPEPAKNAAAPQTAASQPDAQLKAGPAQAGSAQVGEASAKDSPKTGPAAQSAQGQALYTTHCASCHGGQGEGVDGHPGLTDSSDLLDTAELVRAIVKGREGYFGTMPALPGLKDAEIAQIATYAQRTFGKKDVQHEAAEIAKLRAAAK